MVYQVSNYYGMQQYPQIQQNYAEAKRYSDKVENANKSVFGNANVTNSAQTELNPVFNSPVTITQTNPVQKTVIPFGNLTSPDPVNANFGYARPAQIESQKLFPDHVINSEHILSPEDKKLIAYLEVFPQVRRVASLPDKIETGDVLSALGLAALMAVNFPEDCRDVKAAGRQIRSKIDKNYNYDSLYNRRTHQHSFSFLRGTAIEKWVHKQIDKGSKLAERIYDLDRFTLYDTKFGKMTKKSFGIKEVNVKPIEKIKDFKGNKARAYQFTSKIFGGEITARAMQRLPLLSVVALALLEIPKIFKAMGEGNSISEQAGNTAKQTVKSGINVTSTLAGVGYGGAIGAKYAGATGSIVGMGLGAILGVTASKKLQDTIV